MKLRTTVGALLDAFALTSPTLDRKGASANLYLQANEKSSSLYFYSTNLISETATRIKAEIETPGEALVNPGKLSDGLQGLPKDNPVNLVLTPTGNALKVSSGSVRFSLASSTDVKELSDRMKAITQITKTPPIMVLPASELAEFTKRSLFCIPNDQSGQRANLAALKLADNGTTGEEAFATDGSIAVRISSQKKQGEGSIGAAGLLIPVQALTPLSNLVGKRKKGETVSLILTEKKNKVFFKFADGTHFGAITMATNYPNLKAIMEQDSQYHYFEVPREAFKLILNRASAFVASVSNRKILELEFGPEALSINANGDDVLSDQIAISYTGSKPPQSVKVGMNIDHLHNIASGSHSENLTFGFASDTQPLVVTDKEGDDDERIDIKYVVMGVRLGAAK